MRHLEPQIEMTRKKKKLPHTHIIIKLPMSEEQRKDTENCKGKMVDICCPQRRETKADTLKQLRPIGEGDQELEKRLDQEELT
jgi:hypothetical protein